MAINGIPKDNGDFDAEVSVGDHVEYTKGDVEDFNIVTTTPTFSTDNATYGSTDEGDRVEYNGNSVISGDNVTLQNAVITGDLEITGLNATLINVTVTGDLEVNNGDDVRLTNVNAGTTTITDGATSSVYATDSNLGDLSVTDDAVRLVLEGTKIKTYTSDSNGVAIVLNDDNNEFGTFQGTELPTVTNKDGVSVSPDELDTVDPAFYTLSFSDIVADINEETNVITVDLGTGTHSSGVTAKFGRASRCGS